jgi:hypothetical protein
MPQPRSRRPGARSVRDIEQSAARALVKSVRARLDLGIQARGEPVSPGLVYVECARLVRAEMYDLMLPDIPNFERAPLGAGRIERALRTPPPRF